MVSESSVRMGSATGGSRRELMREFTATNKLFYERTVLRVIELSNLVAEWAPNLHLLIRINTKAELSTLHRLEAAGVSNTTTLTRDVGLFEASILPSILETESSLQLGDVIAVTPQPIKNIQVLFRESDMHHTVFLTNRCNSNCLMCSQPPTLHNDSWLIDEAVAVATHMRVSPRTIGFTGGEPLLLGPELRMVLDTFSRLHPGVQIDVLTNGRLFSDSRITRDILVGLKHPISWMVPLYGHADFLHDFVVQAVGAFDQTIAGLLALRSFNQFIQLRIVLIKPVLQILPDLCAFIGRNLPFVTEVALMGCEPTGFALANQEVCKIDILEWKDSLFEAVHFLQRIRMPVVLMNLPLCAIDPKLWPLAHKSISDWKRTFVIECDACEVKKNCCGLFASHRKGWQPVKVTALREAI